MTDYPNQEIIVENTKAKGFVKYDEKRNSLCV
jgi:hypothetical protein